VTPTDLLERFEEIWLHDFEFVPQPGERPDVVCLAAYELRSGRTLRLWRNELGDAAPYRTDDRVLVVSYVGNAELACHLALGWPLPRYVLDLSPAFRNIVSGRYVSEGRGLLGALAYYGFDNINPKHKDAMRKRIMQGWPFTVEEQQQIQDYCHGDVEDLIRLLPKILTEPEFDLEIALHHGEWVAVSALMEHRGLPVDREIYSLLADKKIWGAIRDAMVPIVNAKCGVYVRGAGGWVFSNKQFKAYLAREGILPGWPLLESGELDLKAKVWDELTKCWPQLQELRQLRHMRNKMRQVKLAVGADFRNRTVLWPFKSKTSRTQPDAAKWIFSPATWVRSLIKPDPGMAVAHIDWSAMEFMLAASLSNDKRMLAMYQSGDPYLAYCHAIGAIPRDGTAKTHVDIRHRYKVALLAMQYGMQAVTLAARLGVSVFEAAQMLEQHREQFAHYWAWSNDFIQHAMQTGGMRTVLGWRCRTGETEFNERTFRNWPIQAAGADILRISCILGTRHGVRLVAPNHDAVLIEAPIERIEADAALMQECIRRASRIVLNCDRAGDHELRTDCTIVRYPNRHFDKRGVTMWEHVTGLLAELQQKAEVA
jgi:DNA polymerase I